MVDENGPGYNTPKGVLSDWVTCDLKPQIVSEYLTPA